MKKALNKENIQEMIEENKDLLVPLCILFIAVVLFVVFILPGILSFPSKKGDRDTEVARLNQIKEAKRVLENVNDEQLTEEVEIVTRTLPSDKNFEIILSAISQAAVDSGSQIANYIFSDSGNPNTSEQNTYSGLTFDIGILGGIEQAASFVDKLYESYPVSEVKEISYTNGVSKIIISFYFKPFTSVNAQDAALARGKTAEELNTFQEISEWREVLVQPEPIEINSATDSGTETSF